jgi:hypothetical protein
MPNKATARALAQSTRPIFEIVVTELFYLRKLTVKVKAPKGGDKQIRLYVFFNYRNTIRGTVNAPSRDAAKRAILKERPSTEFFR